MSRAINSDLGALVRAYFKHKVVKETAEHEMDTLKPSILEAFASRVRRGEANKIAVETPEWKGHCTYVPPTEVVELADMQAFLERLTPEQRAMVMTATVDEKKLKQAVDLGVIPAAVVEEYAIVKERSGYIRFSGNPKPAVAEVDPGPEPKRRVIRRA